MAKVNIKYYKSFLLWEIELLIREIEKSTNRIIESGWDNRRAEELLPNLRPNIRVEISSGVPLETIRDELAELRNDSERYADLIEFHLTNGIPEGKKLPVEMLKRHLWEEISRLKSSLGIPTEEFNLDKRISELESLREHLERIRDKAEQVVYFKAFRNALGI